MGSDVGPWLPHCSRGDAAPPLRHQACGHWAGWVEPVPNPCPWVLVRLNPTWALSGSTKGYGARSKRTRQRPTQPQVLKISLVL